MSKFQQTAANKVTPPVSADDPKPVNAPATTPTDATTDATTRTIPAPTTTNSPAIKNN